MEACRKTKKSMGIIARTALMSWLITLMALGLFLLVIIPMQKQTFIEHLNSKALGIAVSLKDVTAGAAINEDYSTVVDHCSAMLKGDKGLEFIVITKNDGYSLVLDQTGWRIEAALPNDWRPEKIIENSSIQFIPLFGWNSFIYRKPLEYSGIHWGWIHVGLSLENYDQSVESLYMRTGFVTIICILLSLGASLAYSKRIVRPIFALQQTVQRVSGGDLSARALVERRDELGQLALSVNSMTSSLQHRDRILQSVGFTAGAFLSTPDWKSVIESILARIAASIDTECTCVYQNVGYGDDPLIAELRFSWTPPDWEASILTAGPIRLPWHKTGHEGWAKRLSRGDLVVQDAQSDTHTILDLSPYSQFTTMILAPIMVNERWWGVLGVLCNSQERKYSEAEQDSIRACADMLGAAISKHQTHEDLLHAKTVSDAANRAKSEFLANMSHELRTPLNHIIGFTDLVLSRNFGELTAEQEEFLKDVVGSSRHLLSLINDVLDLSKVEAGKMELELSEVRIRELLEGSLVMVKEKALKQHIRLSTDLDGVPEEMQVDERKMKQVVYNLLSNSVKFTPAGGEVRIGAKILEGSELCECPIARDENGHSKWLSVWVSDTGIGLEQQNLSRIFNPFEQVEGSASRKFQGTGLGLALTRRMVELHGGAVWAESDGDGKGSTFRFAIPVRDALEAGHAAA